jgi:YVTN family beta-propeller protein
MNDFERRLKESLTEVRDAGRIGLEPRRAVAKDELFRRMRRRRLWNFGGGAVLAGAAAVAAFALFSSIGSDPVAKRPQIDAAELAAPARALVEVGDRPGHVSVGGLNYVWSSNEASNDVSRIDPKRNEVVGTVDVGSPPGDIAIGTGPVWVALPSEGQVVELDPNTQSVAGEPIEIADGPVTHMELSVGAGALWVVARDEGLWRVDLADRTSVVKVEDIVAPTDVAVRGDTVLVLSSEGVIHRLSSATGVRVGTPLQVEATEDGEITLAGETLWYFNQGGETISRLDPTTGEVLNEVDPVGSVVDFVIDPDVAWILSTDAGTHYLTQLDRAQTVLTGEPIEVAGGPIEAVIAGGSLWLSLSEEDAVLRFSKYR